MGLPFLQRQAKKRDHIVAVDLGGRSTKAVHLQRRGDKFSLVNFAIVDTPIYDKAMSPDLLAEHLKNVTKALGNGRARQLTLALGVGEALFRQVEVPLTLRADDLRQVLKYNAKQYLAQDLPDHVFDCYFVAPKQPQKTPEGVKLNPANLKIKAMISGIKKQAVDDLQEAIKGAGLIADQVVPGIIGPANAFELAEPQVFMTEAVALVDIGFKNSSITILDCGDIALNRVIGLGGDRLTAGLAEAMSISYLEAENIKIGMPAEVQSHLEVLIHPLGSELRASIDFFEHQQEKTVGQVFVSGGTARSDYIVQALQNELLVPCKTWNPAKALQMALPSQRNTELEPALPQLTVAIGAAASAF